MNERRLFRFFRHIVAVTLPLSGAVPSMGCSGSVQGSTADAAPPDGGGGGPDSSAPPEDAAPPDGSVDTGPDGQAAITSCGQLVYVNTGGQFSPELVDGNVVGCGIAQCSPWDGGPVDASETDCTVACGGPQDSCTTYVDGGAWVLECRAPLCLGRRPEGLGAAPDPDRRAAPPGSVGPAGGDRERNALLAAYLADAAFLEAASVGAFRRLRRELVSHGAPRRLTRAAERAARDESRHARVTAALARRHGAAVRAPSRPPITVRALEAMAIENAVEGCVRESFGALLATWQGETAEDVRVRAAMKRIARDETRHAALAFAVDAWARARLDAGARARIECKKAEALAELANAAETPEPIRAALGLPSGAQARALVAAMESAFAK